MVQYIKDWFRGITTPEVNHINITNSFIQTTSSSRESSSNLYDTNFPDGEKYLGFENVSLEL